MLKQLVVYEPKEANSLARRVVNREEPAPDRAGRHSADAMTFTAGPSPFGFANGSDAEIEAHRTGRAVTPSAIYSTPKRLDVEQVGVFLFQCQKI
ncbi:MULTISPECIES: hypothetical protein [Streptomyces]|uniref:hypothetical protein n=1 Tax=Streptomyces TaxID=1883 RepID=UPI00345C3695